MEQYLNAENRLWIKVDGEIEFGMFYRINGETYQDAATYFSSKYHLDVKSVKQTDKNTIRLYVDQQSIYVGNLNPNSSVGVEVSYPSYDGFEDYDNPYPQMYIDIPL